MNALVFAVTGSKRWIGPPHPALPALRSWRRLRSGASESGGGRLGAAAILAISPVAIATFAHVERRCIVATLVVGLAAMADRYLQTGRAAWLYGGAAILGVGLASGAGIYSGLLALLVGAGLAVAFGRPDEAQARWRAMRDYSGIRPGAFWA